MRTAARASSTDVFSLAVKVMVAAPWPVVAEAESHSGRPVNAHGVCSPATLMVCERLVLKPKEAEVVCNCRCWRTRESCPPAGSCSSAQLNNNAGASNVVANRKDLNIFFIVEDKFVFEEEIVCS